MKVIAGLLLLCLELWFHAVNQRHKILNLFPFLIVCTLSQEVKKDLTL